MKLAILGASKPHLPLYLKAKEMGIETYCIAWAEGAYCKDYADHFYDISIVDKDAIAQLCMDEGIDGIISNAIEAAVPTMAFVSEKCGFNGNSYESACKAINKKEMRLAVEKASACPQPKFQIIADGHYIPETFPVIVKPTDSSCSNGVTKVNCIKEFQQAIERATKASFSGEVLIEEVAQGREVSVESISYHGKHYVLTITDKETTGEPYFVETAHHQPSTLSETVQDQLKVSVPRVLDALGITNGASHAEFKIDDDGNIKFIEIGARGGGDHISYQLVKLSTGYDYVKGMIEVALDQFTEPKIKKEAYSGVYFLSKNTSYIKDFIINNDRKPWVVEFEIQDTPLKELTKSQDRTGFIIYKSSEKILVNNE